MSFDILQIDPLVDEDLAMKWIDVQTRSGEADWHDEHAGWTLGEVQGRRRSTGSSFVDLAAVQGDSVIGMAALAMPLLDNQHLALLMLHVDPAHRRRGVGRALVEAARPHIEDAGRTVVQAETETPEAAADHPGPSFARHLGATCAQTVIRSAMPLPADRVRLTDLAGGEAHEQAPAFRIDWRIGEIPDEWLPGLAVLEQRMSTDAPQGDLTVEEEVWTSERVRENLDWARYAGRRIVQAVAFHGEVMVGFTQIQVPAQTPTLGYQQDTLVLREARGHRLGRRLKATAALALMDELPEVTRVRTWNADDNRHMLAVNADLGYVPEGVMQVWEMPLA